MINNVDFAVLSAAPKTLTEEEKSVLLYVVALIMRVSHTARRYGLLEVEPIIEELPTDTYYDRFAKKAIVLVVDGFDPEFFEELLDTEILLTGVDSFEAYIYFIIKKGMLAVQSGESPYALRKRFVSCIPMCLREAAEEYTDTCENNINELEKLSSSVLRDISSNWLRDES